MEKIKHFLESEKGKNILIILVIILVGLGSFELGRMSVNKPLNDSKIDLISQEANVLKSTQNEVLEQKYEFKGVDLNGKEYFASSRGTKYYPFGCSAGKSIKEENRIYFATEDEAIKAGYSKSSSCN
jgi:hypothetical protein